MVLPTIKHQESESEIHSIVSNSLWPMEFSRPEYWSG